MDWLGVVRIFGGILGLAGVPFLFASVLHRDPNARWASWPPVPLWRQRGWYSPKGFRMKVLGEVCWTVGTFLCLVLPAIVGWFT